MGITQYVFIDKKRYFYYDWYPSWEKALEIAKKLKKDNKKNKHWIQITEGGIFSPKKRYALYVTHFYRPINSIPFIR